MDEIGFMITHINDNGMIQFTNLGGVANDIWQGQRLKIKNRYGKEIIGVVANILNILEQEMKAYLKSKDLMLDIGASSSEEVRNRGVEVGDTIVPHTIMTQLSKTDTARKPGTIDMVVS